MSTPARKHDQKNRVCAAETCADPHFWDAYARLPRLLRAALQEAVVDWSASEMLQRFTRLAHAYNRAQAEDAMLRALDAAEKRELHAFAKANGGYSAHLAAGASILRYGAC